MLAKIKIAVGCFYLMLGCLIAIDIMFFRPKSALLFKIEESWCHDKCRVGTHQIYTLKVNNESN